MPFRRGGFALTPPSLVIFVISLVLAVAAFLVHYAHVSVPIVSSARVFDVLAIAYVVLMIGVLFGVRATSGHRCISAKRRHVRPRQFSRSRPCRRMPPKRWLRSCRPRRGNDAVSCAVDKSGDDDSHERQRALAIGRVIARSPFPCALIASDASARQVRDISHGRQAIFRISRFDAGFTSSPSCTKPLRS